ncbi:predicted protein [Verticillium alfalfae VaMs.102]|uniref:Predicted protein n=1 Tax=Verticillium alfalfae (strain VaMs.102 / ATCC MYA-4576 / FGSC 10136) TaxID=526221 RepID=C9S8U2_VERA1|nr:predicted protein [Verticillium alfalfae VaMs.102]EEY14019.1 predicted protein [Verticillium alfalfae VaMs.102]
MNDRSVPRFNPAPEQVGMHEDDMSYKDQLDQKAFEARQPEDANDGVMHPVIEKGGPVVEYVPVAAKVLGDPKAERKEKDDKANENPPGPPERPLDDDKIESFLRGQHKSIGKDGVSQ